MLGQCLIWLNTKTSPGKLFILIIFFIYLFLAVLGLPWCRLFSKASKQATLQLQCTARGGFSLPEHQQPQDDPSRMRFLGGPEHRLNSCGTQAQCCCLECGDLPRPGLNPCLLHWRVTFKTKPLGKPLESFQKYQHPVPNPRILASKSSLAQSN